MTGRSIRWLLVMAVCFLALIGVGTSATHYLQEPYNPGFLRSPTITALHVVLGAVYLALAPFQLYALSAVSLCLLATGYSQEVAR